MPHYDYICKKCNIELNNIYKKISENVSTHICPNCNNEMNINYKKYSSSFILKGNGWYKTDYNKNSNNNKEK